MKTLRHKRLSHLPKVPELRTTNASFAPCIQDTIATRPYFFWAPQVSGVLILLNLLHCNLWSLVLHFCSLLFGSSSSQPWLLFSVPFRGLLCPLLAHAGSPRGSLLVSNWLLVYLSMRDLIYIQELCSLLYLWWGAYSFMPEPCIQIHMLLSYVCNVLWTLNSLSFHSMLLIWVSASRALSWFSYLALPAYLLVTLSFCSRKKLWTSAFSSLCLECPVAKIACGFQTLDPNSKKYMWHHNAVPMSTWPNGRQYQGCLNSGWQHHVHVQVKI